MSRAPLKAFAYMGVSAALFSTMNLAARVAASEGAHFTVIAFVRALLGAAVAFGVSRAARTPLRVGDSRRMALRSGLGTVAMVFTFAALSSRGLHLGDAVTLFNLAPVFIALLAPVWLSEQAGRSLWVSIALSLVGVVLVLRPAFLFGHVGVALDVVAPAAAGGRYARLLTALAAYPGFGAGCALAAAAASACAMMMLRQIGQTESAESISVHFGVTASLVFALLSYPFWQMPSAGAALALLGTGLAGGFAQLAMTRAYALEKAARVSSMGYMAVPFSALLGIAFLHESPQPTLWLGMLAVILAGAFTTWRSLRSEPPSVSVDTLAND
jgi:drug/metabolite transporter (DMT)-like permease